MIISLCSPSDIYSNNKELILLRTCATVTNAFSYIRMLLVLCIYLFVYSCCNYTSHLYIFVVFILLIHSTTQILYLVILVNFIYSEQCILRFVYSSSDVTLGIKARTATSAAFTLVVITAPARNRGSATVMRDGVAYSATKILIIAPITSPAKMVPLASTLNPVPTRASAHQVSEALIVKLRTTLVQQILARMEELV